jgi:hypothetical protein
LLFILNLFSLMLHSFNRDMAVWKISQYFLNLVPYWLYFNNIAGNFVITNREI